MLSHIPVVGVSARRGFLEATVAALIRSALEGGLALDDEAPVKSAQIRINWLLCLINCLLCLSVSEVQTSSLTSDSASESSPRSKYLTRLGSQPLVTS